MPEERIESNEEERGERRGRGAGGLLIAGLIGSAVGAIAALLLSPWRGEEARRKLKERAAAAGGAARDKIAGAVRRAKCEKPEEEGTTEPEQ